MSTTRVKALAKLFLLLGLPVTALAGLFGGGVYLGHSHRATILYVEKEWLGMDVVVPSNGPWIDAQIARAKDPKAVKPEATKPSETPETQPETKPPETTPTETKTPETKPPDAPETTPPKSPESPETAPPTLLDPPVRPRMPVTVALADTVSDDLRGPFHAAYTLKIKALVDPGVAPDAFTYVQRTLEWTSQVLGNQLGVDLELTGVVRWDGAPGSLCEHPREGADVILGFSRQAFNNSDPIVGDGCALVPTSPRSRQAPHLRPALFSLGRLLGAAAIGDPGSEAWRAGSWMADVLADDAQPVSLDPESRRAMLLAKDAAAQGEPPWAPAPTDDAPATEEK
ncbi:MAG: hypothetical protein R3B09_33935 [Nannocystaceae bacterium]